MTTFNIFAHICTKTVITHLLENFPYNTVVNSIRQSQNTGYTWFKKITDDDPKIIKARQEYELKQRQKNNISSRKRYRTDEEIEEELDDVSFHISKEEDAKTAESLNMTVRDYRLSYNFWIIGIYFCVDTDALYFKTLKQLFAQKMRSSKVFYRYMDEVTEKFLKSQTDQNLHQLYQKYNKKRSDNLWWLSFEIDVRRKYYVSGGKDELTKAEAKKQKLAAIMMRSNQKTAHTTASSSSSSSKFTVNSLISQKINKTYFIPLEKQGLKFHTGQEANRRVCKVIRYSMILMILEIIEELIERKRTHYEKQQASSSS